MSHVHPGNFRQNQCVAWILRLLKFGAEGDDPDTALKEISRPDGHGDIADLELTLADAKLLLASVQREIAVPQTRAHDNGRMGAAIRTAFHAGCE
jgi:hypothetical protein